MKKIIVDNYEGMSQAAAFHLAAVLAQGYHRRVNVSITAGQTPVRTYELLHGMLNGTGIPQVHYYNFDEIPMEGFEAGLTMSALQDIFFKPNQIPVDQIEVFHANNYQGYDKKLEEDGGLDCMLIGLGSDGHFCGNLSGTMDDFSSGCKAIDVKGSEDVYRIISDALPAGVAVPDYYVTFGPKTVMRAREIIMIVNGGKKAEILKKALEGPVTPEIPASILQLHPNLIVIADREAASLLSQTIA